MRGRSRDTFFDEALRSFRTSRGAVDLPVFCQDYGYLHFFFWADHEKAARKLAATAFVPCRFLNGKAGVVISFFQHRVCDTGPYQEVALSIHAHPKALRRAGPFLPQLLLRNARNWRMGAYVIDVPVSTEIARFTCSESWSYPAFVTRIAIHQEGRRFRGVVDDPDLHEPLLTMDGMFGALALRPRLSGASFVSHATHHGVPLRIRHDVDAKPTVNLGFSGSVQVNQRSEQVMARNLLELDLQGKKPFLVEHCGKARMIRNEGVPIAQRYGLEPASGLEPRTGRGRRGRECP